MKMVMLLILSLGMGLLAPGLAAAESAAGKKVLRHVVAFKFKDAVTRDQVKQVEDAFRALKGKIPEIAAYEWGTNVSPEKHAKGFTHGFILSFNSEKDRDTYLHHPDHVAFGKLVGPVIGDVFVIDFWAQE